MKKLLSLLMLLAMIASCSDDHDSSDFRDEIDFDTKLIKKIEIIDIRNGQQIPFGMINLKYDNKGNLVNVKIEESDYNGGETSSVKETMFAYEDRTIKFSTMHEEGFSVWLDKGTFELNKRGIVYKAELTEDDKEPLYFTYKYTDDCLYNTHARSRGYENDTDIEWSNGNIVMFESDLNNSYDKQNKRLFDRVEYNNYYNDASLDLARLVCFGLEGSEGVSKMCGAEEGSYLNIVGRRVKNMPSRLTSLADGSKVVTDFEYERDRNNRIYEIKVKKVFTYRDEQNETREYKYLIGY